MNLFLLVALLSGRQRADRESSRSRSQSLEATRDEEPGNTAVEGHVEVAQRSEGKDAGEAGVISWKGLDSLGFPELVTRLREAGYPEETVRDIVIGRLDRYLERERMNSITVPDLEWWKPDADDRLRTIVKQESDILRREREKRLAGLLGEDWSSGRTSMDGFTPFYGKVLSAMPPGKAGIVRDIEKQFAEKIALVSRDDQAAGQSVVRVAIAQPREEKRKALEATLSGKEFQAYQLRFSDLARSMRRDLAKFNATSNEFVAIFDIREPVEREIELKHSGLDDGSARARKDLERRAADEIRRALGDARYQEYEFNRDPVYRSARDFVEKVGEAEDKAMSLYEIGGWARLERQRIEKDASLDDLSRRSALAETRRRLDQYLQQILSPDARRRSRELGVDFLDSLPR